MTEKEEEDGFAQDAEVVKCGSEPEIVWEPISLGRMALEGIKSDLAGVMKCIFENVKKGHLPSANLLVAVARYVNESAVLSEAVFESFAQQLVKACEELQAEEDVE